MKKNSEPLAVPDIVSSCPVQHAHQFIGGKWRIGIIWSLKDGRKRFGQLKREVLGISEKMLIEELKHMQKLQMIHRDAYPEIPPKVEYYLTNRGKSLISLVEYIVTWGYSDMEKYSSSANITHKPQRRTKNSKQFTSKIQ